MTSSSDDTNMVAISNASAQGVPASEGATPLPKAKAEPKKEDPKLSKSAKKKLKKANAWRLKNRAAPTAEHNFFTHFPKDPNCPICQQTKSQRAKCMNKSVKGPDPDGTPQPKEFLDQITADHAILEKDEHPESLDRTALIVQDRATNWLQAFPAKKHNTHETKAALMRFKGPEGKVKYAYTDGSGELKNALDELEILHDTSTPHRPQTNGVAERAVRRVKEGASAALAQSGLTFAWWGRAMICFCFLRNVIDIMGASGANIGREATSFKKRYGHDFQGPTIPFGAEIQYLPISKDDKGRANKLGEKLLSGIFVNYDQRAGGAWSGDVYIADWEQIQEAETIHDIYPRRFNAKEVFPVKHGEKFRFPVAEGRLRQPGGTVRRGNSPIPEEDFPVDEDKDVDEEGDTPKAGGEPEEPLLSEEELGDYWSINDTYLTRHHVTPRRKLFTLTEALCPIPIEFVDVQRRTWTNLENSAERLVEDFWTADTGEKLSDFWIGKTVFLLLRPDPPAGYQWVEGRLTRRQKTDRPDTILPETWTSLPKPAKRLEIEKFKIYEAKRKAQREQRLSLIHI